MAEQYRNSCSGCGNVFDYYKLIKCPMCYKMVCNECKAIIGGRPFCGEVCANYFFFGGEDEDREAEGE